MLLLPQQNHGLTESPTTMFFPIVVLGFLLLIDTSHGAGWLRGRGNSHRTAPLPQPIDIDTLDVSPGRVSQNEAYWEPIYEWNVLHPSVLTEGSLLVQPDRNEGYERMLLDPHRDSAQGYADRRKRYRMAISMDPINRRHYEKQKANALALRMAMENVSTLNDERAWGGFYSTQRRAVFHHPDRQAHEVKYAYLQNGLPVLHKDAQGNLDFIYPGEDNYPDLVNLANDPNSPPDPGHEHIAHRPTGHSHYDDLEEAAFQRFIDRMMREDDA